jgi:hypothetical protein
MAGKGSGIKVSSKGTGVTPQVPQRDQETDKEMSGDKNEFELSEVYCGSLHD